MIRQYYSPFFMLLFLTQITILSAQSSDTLLLPPCTPLILVLKEEATRAAHPGKLIAMEVKLDVKVSGQVIIRSGAFAQGQVQRPRPSSSISRSTPLVLVPTIVQAADGSMVHIFGSGLFFGSKRRKNRQDILVGEELQAAVRYATEVIVN